MPNQYKDKCPKEIDLTNDNHSELVFTIVKSLLEKEYSIEELEAIESNLLAEKDNQNIFILLAIKIVKSKLLVKKSTKPFSISVVFAVYNEHQRIKTKSEHPHGKDLLRKKINQLEWLFEDSPNVKWELIIVDDGCPNNSGKIAQSIIDNDNLQNKARVLFLADAIEQKLPVANFNSTKDSQKGGSIIYGMWNAVEENKDSNHIVVFTDADLSTHLGQVMLLVDPILNDNKLAAIGSRREEQSVVIKKGTRNDRGKLFIYLWKRLIPNLGNIIDTQCGFKAFKASIIPSIIEDMIEKKFAFDIELLLKTAQLQNNSITKVPIAWIDSEEASTTTDLQPYLPMLKSIVKMNQKYFEADSLSSEFAEYINALTEEDFNELLNNIPKEITSREPHEFTTYDKVRVKDF